ncbi:SpoVR family protein [Pseudochelatococcus lubricantis]|uniref:SpoVR family protein n=1 Tax=Pseudochelatococcus lubricantis TaxID=1538102 RepID=UPI0035EF80F4
MTVTATHPLLFSGTDWDFNTIRRIYDAVEKVSGAVLGLDTYPNQIEVITAEQMLDAYASTGMPLLYKHWSFGKQFAHHEMIYRKGMGGLAYELVINSNPCINYIMEENTATMQTLVIAHAAFGHNHFFKNNYLFRQWTDAEGILDYLAFAKGYIAACEERHGLAAVERILDIAHSLMNQAVHRYPRRSRLDLKAEKKREAERHAHQEQVYNDLWRTVPGTPKTFRTEAAAGRRRALLKLPEENILYFLEKTAPLLQPWQREVLRIVRQIAQYFYPQSQTKVMNEGCATYSHYRIMTRLHEQGSISDGAFLEFLQSHANVVMQPTFDSPRYSGLNPYAIGFAMMQDIARICETPDDEDREWFPDIAGQGDVSGVLKHVWANYRDESFLAQFLSPRLIREWRLFHIEDDAGQPALTVGAIHDERGYRRIRQALARQYDIAWQQADIQVVDVDLDGDRQLTLQHDTVNHTLLHDKDAELVLQNLAELWGYRVVLREVDPATGKLLKEHVAKAPQKPGLL